MSIQRQLTEEAQADSDEFDLMKGYGCSCHVRAPCLYCTHPGNPMNQEENDECWEEINE